MRNDVWCVKTTVGQKQGWLQPGELGVREIFSPSVQLFLDDESVSLYDLTEQILSDASIHQGNEAPPPYLPMKKGLRSELLRQAGEAGSWLKGLFKRDE